MKILRLIIQVNFCLLLGLSHSLSWAEEIKGSLSLERSVPQQPLVNLHGIENIALAADGSLWTIDLKVYRLQHFNADGTLITQFGSEGKAPGQFSSIINDIAIAADGTLWVADSGNSRIQHLTTDGTVISVLGSNGYAAGQFYGVDSIAIAPDASVWAVGGGRLQHFMADGTFIAQFREIDNNADIAIAADNSLWITDLKNNRLRHLKADGTLIAEFGSEGKTPGHFEYPKAIGIAPDGSLWVIDLHNDRLQHFKADGTFIKEVGHRGEAPGEFDAPTDLAIGADGSLWVADTFNDRLQHLDMDGTVIGQLGAQDFTTGQFSLPCSITVAPDGSLWVADEGNHSLQHLAADGTFITQAEGASQLYGLSDLAIATDGSLWLSYFDSKDHIQILRFNPDGVMIGQLPTGSPKSSSSSDCGRKNFAIAADGSLWVSDGGSQGAEHINADGKIIGRTAPIGTTVEGYRYSISATDIAIAADQSLWITGNNYLWHFGADGRILRETIVTGNKVTIAADGSLWVLDGANDRLHHLDANGQMLEQFNHIGYDESVQGIAMTKEGNLWVADTLNHRIRKLIPNAKTRYLPASGEVFIEDVIVNGQHFWVKLTNQGGWQFSVSDFRPLPSAHQSPATEYHAESGLVTIPELTADGKSYTVTLQAGDEGLFTVVSVVPL